MVVQYLGQLSANSVRNHQGNSLVLLSESTSSQSPFPFGLFLGVFIRIFCDVLVLSSQVLLLETRLWVKMINSFRKGSMAGQASTTWKRSRRKEVVSSTQTYSRNATCLGISSRWCSPVRTNFTFTRALKLVVYLLIVDNFRLLTCAPLPRPSVSSSSMQHYLLKFGYLPQSGFEIRNQVSEERMREAIRELQGFANITVTGEINDATLKLIRAPRCGVPDILTGQFSSRSRHRRYIVQGQKWSKTNLTWRGYHDDGYPLDGKGSILAHAFFSGTGQGGDAHFDDDKVWVIGGKSHHGDGTRLFAVAAHEFGHSLGLSHSDVEGSLMYPWYQNFDYDLQLSQDDMLGIQRIYGSESRFFPNPYPKGSGGKDEGDRRGYNNIPTPSPPVTTRPTHREKNYYPEGRPNTCDSSYDAISLIRDELFIFRGRYFWRINSTPNDNRLLKGYPSLITMMWQQLPSNISHVYAVYEHNKVEILFFIGKQYWRFQGTTLMQGYPKPLSSMGISPDVEKIDGAMIWGYNKKTYLFSGTKYWRLQDERDYFRVEPDYPRDMHIWEGVPYHIDSVLKWKDGNVYFFKGKVFWKFDDKHMRVESKTPTLSAPFWMGCTSTPIIPTENPTEKPPPPTTGSVAAIKMDFSTFTTFLLILIIHTFPN